MNQTVGDCYFTMAEKEAKVIYNDIAEKYITAAEFYFKDQDYEKSGLSYEKAHDIYSNHDCQERAACTAIKAANAYKELKNMKKCDKLEKCEKLLQKAFIYYMDKDKCKAADQSALLASIYIESIDENNNYIIMEEKNTKAIKLYEQAWTYYKDSSLLGVAKGFNCLKTAAYIAINNYQYTKALELLNILDTDKRYIFINELIIDTAIVKLYVSGISECREWFFIKHDTRSFYYVTFSKLIVSFNTCNLDLFSKIVNNNYNGWQKKLLLKVLDQYTIDK